MFTDDGKIKHEEAKEMGEKTDTRLLNNGKESKH